MFSINKAKAEAEAAKIREKPTSPSILSKNLRVTGNLETEGEIQIDGVVDGDVKSSLLTIARTAVINGSISGDTVRVNGTVSGQIRGRVVEVSKSAKVSGDIVYEILDIEAGAFIYGMCMHVGSEKMRPT